MATKELSIEFIENKVRGLAKLSTLPFVATSIMELVENPRTSAARLCELISTDQVLAARILKLANSAYYGFPRKISTLNLAVVVLGFNALRDLVLSISLIDRFAFNNNIVIDMKQYWRHALIVGRGSRLLAKMFGYPVIGEVFVGGLLHDIGYLVELQHFPEQFTQVYELSQKEKIPFNQAELIQGGLQHANVGAWLAEGWNLPNKLVQTIKYHHTPTRSTINSDLVNFIHLSNIICYSIGEGNGIDTERGLSNEEIEKTLQELFPRNNQPLHVIQDKFRLESEKIEDFLKLLKN